MPSLVDMNNILKGMMSDSGYRYTEKGKEKVLKNLPLDQAINYLNKMIDAQVDPKNFQKHLDDFRKKKTIGSKGSPEHFKTHLEGDPAEMKKRLDYSVKCRKTMLNIHKRYMGRRTLWDKTVGQVFGTNKGGKPAKHVQPLRWMDRLLRMDGSPESQAHNEKLVTLAAWRNRVIDAEEFQAIRANSYQKAGKTAEEAQMLAQQEREYGMDALLDMYKQKVNDTWHRSDEVMEAGRAILSGNCQNVEAAYEILLEAGDGIYLAYNSKDAMENMLDSSAFRDANVRREGLRKEGLHYEGLLGSVKAIVEIATDVVPSPQYAYLDPADMQKYGVGIIEGDGMDKDWDMIYANSMSQNMEQLMNFALEEQVNDFGLPSSPDALLSTSDIRVYKDENSDRTLIIDIEYHDFEHGVKGMQVNENVPGRLINKHLKEEMENWLGDLNRLTVAPQAARSRLKDKLENVRDMELSDVPSEYEISRMRRALRDLGDAVTLFQRDLADETWDKENAPVSYGRSEKFANNLSFLLEMKQEQLNAVEAGVKFLNEYKIDDNLDSIGAERIADGKGTRKIMEELLSRKDEPEHGGHIMDESADENIIHTEAQSPEQLAENKMKEAVVHNTLDEMQNDYKSRYQMAAEQYKEASKRFDAAAASYGEKFSAEQKMSYLQDEAKWENYVNQFGKQWMASQVVGELLKLETKLPEDKHPMHSLAEAGRFDDLVDMVRNSDKFVEEISVADLSQPGEIERMMKQRAPKNIAKIIMRNYLASEKQRKNAPKPGDEPQKATEREQPKNNPIIV